MAVWLVGLVKRKWVTLKRLWDEHIADNPDGYSYPRLTWHYRVWRQAEKITMHMEHKAGDKMFVDFAGEKLFMNVEKLPHFPGCIACGKENHSGLQLELYYDKGLRKVFAEIIFEKRFIGYEDIIHGGIITTVLDESMAWVNIKETGRMALTKNLKISFYRPVRFDEKYRVESYVENINENIAYTHAILKDSEGRICAESDGEFILMSETRSENMKKGLKI